MTIISLTIMSFAIFKLAKNADIGERGKFFIHLIITSVLISLLYNFSHTIFVSISIEKIVREYNSLTQSYEKVKIEEWSDKRNVYVKNQLIYNFYHKNKNGEICKDLRAGVTNDLKNEINKVSNFENSQFSKESVALCEVTKNYREREDENSCATKESGLLCSWINPVFKKFNTEFKIYSIEPPKEIENKEIEENPLDFEN